MFNGRALNVTCQFRGGSYSIDARWSRPYGSAMSQDCGCKNPIPASLGVAMSRFRISTRLYLLVGLSLLVVSLAMAVTLSTTADQLLEERKDLLRTVDEVALSIVQKRLTDAKNGLLSEDEAREAALAELAAVRYGESGYLWVNDLQQVVLMHPIKPELNGKDVTDWPAAGFSDTELG